MNKLFIVVLAVCLLSVNCALVKRDTATTESELTALANKLSSFAADTKAEFDKTFNAENIQKQFNDLTQNVNKWIDGIKNKPEEPKQ